MVKTVELTASVQGYTAQTLFEIVYSVDGAFLRHYHRTVNNDPDASIGEWSGDERSVSFTTPVDAPKFIKSMIGKEVMRVVEKQRRSVGADGSVTLTSTPLPDMPGGSRFSTQAVLTFRDVHASLACQIDAVITCSASGPYGLTGTIESFMAEAGRKSLQEFLDAVQQYAQVAHRWLQEQAAPAAAAAVTISPTPAQAPIAVAGAAAAAAAAAPPVAELPAAAEQFYDALELPLPMPSGDGLRFEDAALLYLRYMCRTGDQTVGLLQSLDLQVRSLQSSVAQLQQAAEERQRAQRWLPQLPETISTRQALLGAALVAASSAAVALTWSRRHHQHTAAA